MWDRIRCFVRSFVSFAGPEVGDCRLWLTFCRNEAAAIHLNQMVVAGLTIMPNHTQPFVRKFECYLQAASWSWLRVYFARWMGKTQIEMEQQTEARGLEFWTKGLQIAIGLCVYIYIYNIHDVYMCLVQKSNINMFISLPLSLSISIYLSWYTGVHCSDFHVFFFKLRQRYQYPSFIAHTDAHRTLTAAPCSRTQVPKMQTALWQ